MLLTRTEQRIFDFLHRCWQNAPGKWQSAEAIGEATIGWPNSGLKTHVCRIRKKLPETGWRLETAYFLGYRLMPA